MDAWEGANGLYKFTSDGNLEDKFIFLKMFRDEIPVLIQGGGPKLLFDP
jgi:hypothetical protein